MNGDKSVVYPFKEDQGRTKNKGEYSEVYRGHKLNDH